MPPDDPEAVALSCLHHLLGELARSGLTLAAPLTISARDDIFEARLFLAPRRSLTALPADLTDMETNIVEALAGHHMGGRDLAVAAGYRYNSHFRTVLGRLKRRGLLARDAAGYHRI